LSVVLTGSNTIRISGTPTAAGTFDDITISINDAAGATATSAPFAITIQTASTQTMLTSSPAPAAWVSDLPTTFTATVSFVSGSGTLTGGIVTFWDGPVGTGTNLGTGTLNASGVATLTTTLTAGPHAITAVYDGTATITGSTSNTQQNANVRRFSHLTLSSSPDPVATQPTTFTAVLTGASGALAGQIVTFTINGTDYTATTNANGVAAIDFTFADPGTYTVSVRFRNPLYNDADASITLDVAPNGVLV
jgi:hypothetical protein